MEQGILTLEEFCKKDSRGIPRYVRGKNSFQSGFFGWFILNSNPISVMNRQAEQFVRFQQTYPELERDITRKVSEAIVSMYQTGESILEAIKSLEPILYDAYIKMRTLIDSNEKLGLAEVVYSASCGERKE